MKPLKLLLPVLVLGLGLASLFSQGPIVDATIFLDGDQSRVVSVTPDPIELGPGDRVRWRTLGADDGTFRIDFEFKSQVRGPFPKESQADNPERGRFIKNVGATIVTEAAQDIRDQWKYEISWTRGDGREAEPLDPTVIVR